MAAVNYDLSLRQLQILVNSQHRRPQIPEKYSPESNIIVRYSLQIFTIVATTMMTRIDNLGNYTCFIERGGEMLDSISYSLRVQGEISRQH